MNRPLLSLARLRFVGIFAISSLLLLSSCLDIEEEIFLNADGSGTYISKVDMTEMLEMILMMAPDSVKESADTDHLLDSILSSQEMTSTMASTTDQYNSIAGITGAVSEIEDGVFKMQFNFDSPASLNEALAINADGDMGLGPIRYQLERRKFTRHQSGVPDLEGSYDESQMEMAKMMLTDATYTTRIHFPGKVKRCSNDDATIVGTGRTVVMEAPMLDLMEDPSLLENTVKFKWR